MNSRNFNFPPIFKAVRAYHGIGQEELASIIECSQSNISKIENNQKNPDLAKFLKSKNFNPLILVIENHPIPFSLIDEFKLGLNNSNKKLL